jgi:hypothetical protein
MYAIAMAYCGTADNESIRKLLHVAVSDVSDDVRRAAGNNCSLATHNRTEWMTKTFLDRITLIMQFRKGRN